MKVQRKGAQPYNGEPIPYKLAIAISEGRAKLPIPSKAIFPIVECTRWMKHGDHSKINRIPKDHFHHTKLVSEGKDPSLHGHCKNMVGHLSIVSPGEHILDYPDGLIHHPYQDISQWYEIK
jgi:hypothetical protein